MSKRSWHGQLRLEKSVVRPQDINISLSELAYMAAYGYIDDAPQESVENFKRLIAIERRRDNTYSVAVKFDLSEDLYAQLTGRKFAATFVAYALTEYIKGFEALSPDERRNTFEGLERFFYLRKKEALERPAQAQIQKDTAQQAQAPVYTLRQDYFSPQPVQPYSQGNPPPVPLYTNPYPALRPRGNTATK